jgi:hypothetical protein
MNCSRVGLYKKCHTKARNFCLPAMRQNKLSLAAADCSYNVAPRSLQHPLHNSLLITCQQILRLPTTARGKSKTKLFTLKWFYFNIGTKESPPSLLWRERKTGLGTASRYRMLLQWPLNLYHSSKPCLKNQCAHISLSEVINVPTASRLMSPVLCRQLCWTWPPV